VTPETIGHYRILEPLGAGGMGTVYRAQHTTLTSRIVAIKILSDAVIDQPEIRDRFLREAEIMSALHHENIVMLHDFLIEGGSYAIVMELVDGLTLDRCAGEGPVPFARAAPLLRQLLAALSHAHAHGVVHRDVKPRNVLVTSAGVVKVTDFGIARLARSANLTQTGISIGTPRYMSPEQIQGRREITPASDIYSCGVLAHRLLAGSLPFDAPDEESFSILQAHVSSPPPRLRELVPGLDPRIESAVLRALAKDPADRWPSCEDFAAALGLGPLAGVAAPLDVPVPAATAPDPWEAETRYAESPSAAARRSFAVPATVLVAGAALVAAALWWSPWSSQPPSPGDTGAPMHETPAPARGASEAALQVTQPDQPSPPVPPPSPAAAAEASSPVAPATAKPPPQTIRPAEPPSPTPAPVADEPPPVRPAPPPRSPALIKAEAFVEAGQPDKALAALQPLLDAEPANADALALRKRALDARDAGLARRRQLAAAKRAEAKRLFDKGKFDLAIERWKESLEIEPNDASARRGIESAKREKAQLWQQAQTGATVIEKEAKPKP
jgi:serine/threonine protein kinase